MHGRLLVNWINEPKCLVDSREGLRRHNMHYLREDKIKNVNLSTIRENFFLNRTIPLWNDLPPEVKDAATVNDFKAGLDAWQNTTKRLS